MAFQSSLISDRVKKRRIPRPASTGCPTASASSDKSCTSDCIMSHTSSRSSLTATTLLITLTSLVLIASLSHPCHGFLYDTDLSPSSRDHDFRLLDDLVHEDSIHMHELSLRSNFRHKRDTSSDELESMAKLKKTSTKKATQVFKPKPSPVNPFKSTSLAPAYPADASSSRIETSDSSGHIISPSVSSSGSSASSFTASSPAEGSPFFAPEDVTLPPNSNSSEDHHQYYNSTFISEAQDVKKYWIESEELTIPHDMLSNSHRRAATIQLKFPFPFYGHPIKNVTIATGGFLYLGETVHSWLAATQYIAPLMANFDTSISNYSSIKYVNNETHFIVQWRDVELQDQKPQGNFSFQVTLKNNGDIIFVYKAIPFPITEIPDSKHPVKVGISDAYVIDRTVFFIRRKTIYEYHRADLKKENISNNTAIYFTALPTCVALTDCESCVTANIAFECRWCDSVQRCSDGFDRHRQDWLLKKCDSESHSKDTPNRCKAPPPTPSPPPSLRPVVPGSASSSSSSKKSDQSSDYNRGSEVHSGKVGAMFSLILIAFVAGIGLWIFYAYKNPQTGAGQFLIKYRPAEWRWNQADTRYTAASIHM